MYNESLPYRALCTEYYELDRPYAPPDALEFYLKYAEEAKGLILEPMCGSGRFLIPLLEKGYSISGFDYSPFMLNRCRRKCEEKGLTANVLEATFETCCLSEFFKLIFIPSGSFCHLVTSEQVSQALKFIVERLTADGKFIFEVETVRSVHQPQGIWKGRWVYKPDGSKIVMNVLTQFDEISKIETGLFRYELWEKNIISQIEVEEFHVRHYEPTEIENILSQHGLKIIGKWQTVPHAQIPARDDAAVILYECIKL